MTRYTINSHFNIPDSEKAKARLAKSNMKLKNTKFFQKNVQSWYVFIKWLVLLLELWIITF